MAWSPSPGSRAGFPVPRYQQGGQYNDHPAEDDHDQDYQGCQDLSYLEQLRSSVWWGPTESCQVLLYLVESGGKPKVPDHHLVPGSEEHVLCLDVPVYHTLAVHVADRAGYLTKDDLGSLLGQLPCNKNTEL